jgi:Zn-dependent peptidase ImmA (M78 family)
MVEHRANPGSVPAAYPDKFQNRQAFEIACAFAACLLTPDRVVAAIDEVTAEAVLAAR